MTHSSPTIIIGKGTLLISISINYTQQLAGLTFEVPKTLEIRQVHTPFVAPGAPGLVGRIFFRPNVPRPTKLIRVL